MGINIRLPKPSGIKEVMTLLSLMSIPSNALLHRIEQELDGREAFKDTNKSLDEKIYHGTVFNDIANEMDELKGSPMYPSQKVINQLEELAKLVDTDYVLITKV